MITTDEVWRRAFMPKDTTTDEDWRAEPKRVTVPGPLTRHAVQVIKDSFPSAPQDDPVDHPSHYTQYQGLEIIDLVEQMNFCKGNAVKYIARAGYKNPDTEIEDLEKAMWYCAREIERLRRNTPDGIDQRVMKLSTEIANLRLAQREAQ